MRIRRGVREAEVRIRRGVREAEVRIRRGVEETEVRVRIRHGAGETELQIRCGVDLDHFALRRQKRGGLLGTGTGGEEGERVKARPRIQ